MVVAFLRRWPIQARSFPCAFYSTNSPPRLFPPLQLFSCESPNELETLPEVREADQLTACGHFSQASEHVSRAIDIIKNVPDPSFTIPLYYRMIKLMQYQGNLAKETAVTKQLIEALSGLPTRSEQAESLLIKAITSLAVCHLRSRPSVQTAGSEEDFTGNFVRGLTEQRERLSQLGLTAGVAKCHILQGLGLFLGRETSTECRDEWCKARALGKGIESEHVLCGDSHLLESRYWEAVLQTQHLQPDEQTQAKRSQEDSLQAAVAAYQRSCEQQANRSPPSSQGDGGHAGDDEGGTAHTSSSSLAQSPQVLLSAALLASGSLERAKEGLNILEKTAGSNHPLVSDALRVVAGLFHEQGEALSSEGLFRSAVAKLQRPAPFAVTAFTEAALAELEWNGKLRTNEAINQLSMLADLSHSPSSRCFELNQETAEILRTQRDKGATTAAAALKPPVAQTDEFHSEVAAVEIFPVAHNARANGRCA
eukprot:CAMPEP_0175176812 /NCGR_PEP_ID=MMETSP0087-20121206/34014_1 /TAXON_ID=136419 /ORGANISM="Unknown Unknown, Strain D1" /LENGTH=480 /DNA_ID=CAMNT_0016468671 /DNA_START=187 /DNA_END=1628 /DNA_ORIENTATION=+